LLRRGALDHPAMTIPLIINGAAGRMGRRIAALALEQGDKFSVIAGVDRQPGNLRDYGLLTDIKIFDKLPEEKGAVVVDFSHQSAFLGICRHCAQHGMPLISGTTGISPGDLDQGLSLAQRRVPVLHALNMSVGVNVVFQIAAQVARTLGLDYDIEVVEAHHNQKKDAPSGTAYGITDSICAATGRSRSDLVYGRDGETGARPRGEIGVHSLRMGDVVGDHTAYFVGNGERIIIGHVANSRDIFVGGALRAAAFIAKQKPGRYGMANVLGL
jgi:4-hydroxy-tetrahydrodipicolinate reductase